MKRVAPIQTPGRIWNLKHRSKTPTWSLSATPLTFILVHKQPILITSANLYVGNSWVMGNVYNKQHKQITFFFFFLFFCRALSCHLCNPTQKHFRSHWLLMCIISGPDLLFLLIIIVLILDSLISDFWLLEFGTMSSGTSLYFTDFRKLYQIYYMISRYMKDVTVKILFSKWPQMSNYAERLLFQHLIILAIDNSLV